MNLFQYTPQVYKGTQVDLPLDFIYKQLETKQKEFDLQQAAVDKAAENFLKITPGMLTKDAYDRVKQQYLPQIEKIRDTLVNTGNVSMAAPELSKFTMNLAADSEVKKVMQDYEATKLYQQGLLEGRYTDMDFANLYDAQGNVRPQLRQDEAFSPMLYAPAKYMDPVDLLKEDVQKFKADLDELPPTEWRDKDGRLITDSVTIEQLKKERIADYVRGRQPSIINSPQYKAWVNRSTDWGTKPMTSDIYEERVTQPLLNFAYRQIKRDRQVTNPVAAATGATPGKTLNGPTSPENKESNNLLYTSTATGKAEVFRDFNNERSLENPDELFAEINNVNKKQAESFKIITGLTGINGAITPQNFKAVQDYHNKYYRLNDEGHLIKKSIRELHTNPTAEQLAAYNNIPEITPELEEAFNLFNNASIYRTGAQNMWQSITGGKPVNAQAIAAARQKASLDAFNSTAGVEDGRPFVTNNNYNLKDVYQNALNYLNNNPTGNLAGQADSFIKMYENKHIDKDAYNKKLQENIKSNLIGTPEGETYQAFEKLKNRLAQIEITNLKENDELEKMLIPSLRMNRSNVRLMSTNENVWSGKDGGEEFLASFPTDDKGNIDYKSITTGFGLDPENGLVGVVSMNGKIYEFDIDNTNYDQFITQGNPEIKTKIRFYDQVYNTMKRSSNTSGNFTIGNINFNFKTKASDLAKDPKFTYRYNFGEGEIETNNLGDIYSAATRIAKRDLDIKDATLQMEYRKLQDWYSDKYRQITTWQQREALDAEFQRKLKEATDTWEKNNSQTVTIGKDVGKQKQWTVRPNSPLQ
jgi:hypothetical protein